MSAIWPLSRAKRTLRRHGKIDVNDPTPDRGEHLGFLAGRCETVGFTAWHVDSAREVIEEHVS
jgi:hypothetical protein